MSGAPNATAEPEMEITPEMIEAGVNAIGPFDLNYALEGGYSEKAELVIQIYRQMTACRRSP
jgi:hypothetical protein